IKFFALQMPFARWSRNSGSGNNSKCKDKRSVAGKHKKRRGRGVSGRNNFIGLKKQARQGLEYL
ncbi:MAG: hypothetical protein IIU30_09225, partial [Treponema sp.]|nr:hypothetical protein [Treponema sp.]